MCLNEKYAIKISESKFNCIDAEPKSHKIILITKEKYYEKIKEGKNKGKDRINPNIKIIIPCGKCFECNVQKANEWATRCYLENKIYKESCFITLTYNDENIPIKNGKYTLNKKDVTNFKKD